MFSRHLKSYRKISVGPRGFLTSIITQRGVKTEVLSRSFHVGKEEEKISNDSVKYITVKPLQSKSTLKSFHSRSHQFFNLSIDVKSCLNSTIHSSNAVQIQYLHTLKKHEGGYKMHTENENNFLYKVLLDIPELKDTLAPVFQSIDKDDVPSDDQFQQLIKTDFTNVDKSKLLESFKKVTFYMYDKEDNLTHKLFDNLCAALVRSMESMSDDELCKILYLLQIWTPKCFRTDKNYQDIYCAIDKVQLKRSTGRNSDYSLFQLLLLIDFWGHLNLLRSSNFCKLGLKKLLNKSFQLGAKPFVQVMYYHCKYRTFHPLVSAYNIEFAFGKIYNQLTPVEISVVLLAFFKSEKRFVDKNLSLKIAKTFINSLDQLNSVSTNGYLKSLKHYFPLEHRNALFQVCDKLYEIIDKTHPLVLPHAALLGTKLDVYHGKLIDKIVEKTIENVDNLRIKDLEKILLPVSLFNHKLKQPEFLDITSNEFLSEKRKDEVDRYPKTLISFVHHLIIKNQFNFQLIEKCLDIDFLHKSFGKKLSGYVIPKDLLFVDLSVEIEAPDYRGPRLPESLRHALCKHYAWRKPGELFHNKEVKSDEFVVNLKETLVQLLGGEEFTHLAYVLPHFIRPDLLICLKDGKPLPIPESMSDFVHMNAYPPPPTGTWYAFVFTTYFQQIRNEEGVQTHQKGNTEAKVRQLKSLGYKPIVIGAFDWINESNEGKEKILRDSLGLSSSSNSAALSG